MLTFDTLYSWVKDLPIIDWHNHLDLQMLAEDKPLGSLYEVWVKSDPYKHRAMRICGEPERLITAGVEESAKWAAWMRTLPKLVGNPLFAWAKMELEWLGLDAEAYLHGRGENISLADWTPSKMLKRFNVEYLSPCVGLDGIEALDDLEVLGNLDGMSVVPSLRMNAGDEVSVEVLEKFNAAGCRIVDVSVDDTSHLPPPNSQLPTVAAFAAAHGWTMLLHLGALRETSARLRAAAGPAGGFAGMRAPVDPVAVATFLDRLETGTTDVPSVGNGNGQNVRCPSMQRTGCPLSQCNGQDVRCPSGLPRTILLSLNPEAHAQLAVLAGAFNGEGMPGKVQLGPAWWWCDHEEGIRDVLEKSAAYGVLSTFIGMTTDSRSLLSFVRHDYFRRILCKWVAEKVAAGAFPADEALLRPMLENICHRNAERMIK